MEQRSAAVMREAFAKRLRELRRGGGYTHARAFAEALGLEEHRYTRYERAEVEPSVALVHRICKVLQIAPNDLFGFQGIKTQAPPERLQRLLTDARNKIDQCMAALDVPPSAS